MVNVVCLVFELSASLLLKQTVSVFCCGCKAIKLIAVKSCVLIKLLKSMKSTLTSTKRKNNTADPI